MDLLTAMKERRSCRAFKPDLISKEKIENILKKSLLAPSAINLQPWEFIVVTGEEKERLSRRLIKAYKEKQLSCSPGNVNPLPKTISKRGAKTLFQMKPFFEEMGVDPDQYINEGSCNFYGAPAVVFICMDDAFPERRIMDIGLVLGYLLLSVYESGLGACPIGLISAYEDEIKEALNIPENKKVIVSVALGVSDEKAAINRFKSSRDDLEKFIRWIEQ